MKTMALIKNEKGFILIAVYLVVTLVAILAFAFFARNTVFVQAVERNQNKIVAFNMAEAAVDIALDQLAANAGYTGTTGFVPLNTDFVRGGYTITVTTPNNNLNNNSNVRVIRAQGFAPSNDPAARAYQTATVTAYAELIPNQPWNYMIFAANSISLTDNDRVANLDSYDSRIGTGIYGENGNVSSNANIAVNGTAVGAVSLDGKTLVNGNVYVGVGGNPATGISIGKQAAIGGTTGTLSQSLVYATPSTTLAPQGEKTVHGADEYLPAGTYHFTSLNITSSLILTGTGPTTIFVDGAVNLDGQGIVSQDKKPPNLIIYVLGTDTVKVSGQGNFYGGIYAPRSQVQNYGQGSIFGSVIAKSYDQNNNASLHFDKAMSAVQSTQNSRFRVKVWQEQNSLTWGT